MQSRNRNAHEGSKRGRTKGARQTTKSMEAPHPLISKKLPSELLQLILDVFRNSFLPRFNSSLPETLQQVKQHLYNRDFHNAFGREYFLEAYTVRWSPSRALAYANVFYNLLVFMSTFSKTQHTGSSIAQNPLDSLEQSLEPLQESGSTQRKPHRIVCIGAGAGAEIVALGAFLSYVERHTSADQTHHGNVSVSENDSARVLLDIQAVDIADWKSVISRLYEGFTVPSSVSPSASVDVDTATRLFANPDNYKLQFLQQDVLNMENTDLATAFTDSMLVTLMFTLNELYSTSISATTNFLLALTMLLSPGALLLVIDSPGSYSTVKLGSSGENPKKYPMQWLLDHTLLESASVGSSKNSTAGEDQWEKIESRESEWFRLPKELKYPIDLEDMRFQLHVYRRL